MQQKKYTEIPLMISVLAHAVQPDKMTYRKHFLFQQLPWKFSIMADNTLNHSTILSSNWVKDRPNNAAEAVHNSNAVDSIWGWLVLH